MAGVTDPSGQISIDARIAIRGLSWKTPVRVATTASVTISTALNAGDSIDGVTLAAGDRVLVKNQATPAQNGIYIAGVTPIRAWDMDQDQTTAVPAEEVLGSMVYVIAGTAGGGKFFYSTNTTIPTVLGTTGIVWAEFTGSGIAGITVQDEGTPLTTDATTLNFTGAGVTATGSGATKTIDVPSAGITVQDESTPLATAASTLDFQGSGVTASGTGATKVINIPGGGVANVDVDIFTTTGNDTWTKPTCTMVRVILIGGGAGGGSGRKGTGTRLGGGGGGGGGMTVKDFLASDLGSTEKLTVGSGGTGGTSQTTNANNGNPGNNGNPSFFGNSSAGVGTDAKAYAGGGFGGGSGTNSATAVAGPGFGNVASAVAWTGGYNSETLNDMVATAVNFFAGGAASTQSSSGRSGSIQFACGGGGGGGAVITATERNGGVGGVPVHRAGQAPVPANGAHLPGSNGTAITGDTMAPGGFGGSGGGGANTGPSGPPTGGNGGLYGGGGGGGGAGTDSVVNSGAGGNGADGIVVVISW